MTGRAWPRYVTRPNEQAFAPPYAQDGCALHAFALPADRVRLQRIVDRYVTEPSAGRVHARVEAEHVLLYFCDFERSRSLNPHDARRGWLGERELGLWIPIQLGRSQVPTFFVHAMIVDSGPAMCSGREVLGLPKELGHVSVARAPSLALTLAADVLAMGDRSDQAGGWKPLVELERIGRGSEPRDLLALGRALGRGIDQVAELLGAGVASGGPGRAWTRPLGAILRAGRGRVDLLALKQLRDAVDPTRACYQAVARSRATLVGLHRLAPTGAYAYRIRTYPSHPWVEELGLPSEGRAHGLFCELDLELGPGDQP